MKLIKKNLGPVLLVVMLFLSIYLVQCVTNSDNIQAAAAPGNNFEFWRVSDSTFALISQNIREGTVRIVREDSPLALLTIKLPGLLDLLQYRDTLRLSNDTLHISGGNGVALANYVGAATTIADSLNLSGPNPVVLFDDTSPGGRAFQIRSVSNAFELYDVTSGLTRLYIDADGRIGFRAVALFITMFLVPY